MRNTLVDIVFSLAMFAVCILPAVVGVIVGLEIWMALGGWLGVIVGCMVTAVIEIGAYFGLSYIGCFDE